jgi:hypothetical protein
LNVFLGAHIKKVENNPMHSSQLPSEQGLSPTIAEFQKLCLFRRAKQVHDGIMAGGSTGRAQHPASAQAN